MTTEQKQDLLKRLKRIKESGPFIEHFGICGNVFSIEELETPFINEYYEKVEKFLAKCVFAKWPKFSGKLYAPIPHVDGAYIAFARIYNKWDKSTEYGCLRWELLDFLIEEISKQIES